MSKNIVIGTAVGIILGIIAFAAFEGGLLLFVMTALLGITLGWLSTQRLRFSFYVTAVLIGIVYYVPIAIKTGLYADDVVTGGVIGLVIALFTRLVEE